MAMTVFDIYIGFRVAVDFLVDIDCLRGASWRSAQDHIHIVGTLCHEVGARGDGTEQNHVEGIRLRVGGLPHGGASIHFHSDAHIAQVALCQVGPATDKLIRHMAILVGDNVDAGRVVGLANLCLLAIDDGFLGYHGSQRTGIIDDGHHGILGNFMESFPCVEVDIVF